MARSAVEVLFQGASTPISSYDSTKLNYGSLIRQYNLGSNPEDKFASPVPNMIGRPLEQSTAFAAVFPHAVVADSNTTWWFLVENSTAAATRRIMLYETNIATAAVTWRGFVTITFPTATAYTVRGFRITRDLYTTGTVSVSGTAVTGVGTAWQTARFAAGARIGFGSTDPTQITTWYQISAIGSDTSITLTAAAATFGAGTPFVIDELRAIIATTNATTTNGGLNIVKGLCYDIFTIGGTAIPAATTVDNIRASYWIKDAAVETNITAAGCAIKPKVSNTDHSCYVLDTQAKVYVYNLRAALTLTAGATSALDGAGGGFKFATGVQAVTGTMGQSNNGRIGTLNHGVASGVECLYFYTTTRIYRCAVSLITNGSVTWQSDAMTEIPPGGVATYNGTGVLSAIEIADTIDRLIIGNSNGRSYVTQYNTVSNQFDHVFIGDQRLQLQGAAALSRLPITPNTNSQPISVWSEGGLCCIAIVSTSILNQQVFWVALGAHWTYAASTNQRLIAPKMSTTGATKLYRALGIAESLIGDAELGLSTEPYRIYARTSGIDDNSGAWTLLNEAGDLSSFAATGFVQLMFEFKILGLVMIPAKILGAVVTFETSDIPPELSWYANDTDATNSIQGFVQDVLFAASVPNLNISWYKASDNTLVQSQDSTGSANGVFEFWNGSAWTAGTGTNTVGLRRRYRATTALPAAERIYPILKTI